MELEQWQELPKGKKRLILMAGVAGLLFLITAIQPLLWPGGVGIQGGQTVIETIESDEQGNAIKTIEQVTTSEKTLWDWLGLLGVPLSIAILGWWLQQFQQKQSEEKAKEEDLQVYIDRISTLLLDKNLLAIAAQENKTVEQQELLDTSVDVIRARTLSTLRKFKDDCERKTSVIRFLIEADVIGKLKLSLEGANLYGVELGEVNLKGAKLANTDLRRAFLSGADLSSADLRNARLGKANLMSAILENANLSWANLSDARLSDAKLKGAKLQRATLTSASLLNVDFDEKTVWPDRQYIEGAWSIPYEVCEKIGLPYRPITSQVAEAPWVSDMNTYTVKKRT